MKLSPESKINRSSLIDQYLRRSKGILHLGAHFGQEAERYSKFSKPVVWVEALPETFQRLTDNISRYPEQRAVLALLDERDGVPSTFKVSNNMNGVSSSIFDFDEYGSGDKSLWPEANLSMVSEVELESLSLDTVFALEEIQPNEFDLWVVDLQGAELRALKGAQKALRHCNAVLIEVSKVPVYKGGVLWEELENWLSTKGFLPLWMPELDHDDVLFIHSRVLDSVKRSFRSQNYIDHNTARLQHLATLDLPIQNASVLELGAGIGDHTEFYLERNCTITVTEVRPENLLVLKDRFVNNSSVKVISLDMDAPEISFPSTFDLIHCYGLLYHLKEPELAIEFMARNCDLLCLETCVAPDDEGDTNPVIEPIHNFTQAYSGLGCRPNTEWILDRLSKYFLHAFICPTQPNHPEFQLGKNSAGKGLFRRVFIAFNKIKHDFKDLKSYS